MTREMQPTTPRRPWFGGDHFEQLVALLMTLVLIQTAVVTYWFTLADDSNGDAGRDAQIYAIQGLGRRAAGNIQSSYAQTGAYQRWVEMNTLAKLADQKGDTATALRYRALRDRVAQLSPALQPPYFNPDAQSEPNISAFEADTYLVESVALYERFANQSNLKQVWFDRAGAFTVHLTLLAVTLFLFGLASTAKSRVRWVFIAVGLALASVTLVWMVSVQFQPVSGLPEEAIKAYARGWGLAYQDKQSQAIAAYDEALQIAPTYAHALRERAYAHFDLDESADAAADLERARAAGEKSGEVAGNLAWAYYLLGRFDDAIALNRVALKIAPDEMWIQFDLGSSLLAAGQVSAAQAQYVNSMNQAARAVAAARATGKEPPSSLWWAIDASAVDLDALIQCLSNQKCKGAPPFQSIASDDPVKRAADDLRVRMKELAVALEYTGKPPAGSVSAVIEPLKFTQEPLTNAIDLGAIEYADTFTSTEEAITISFDYAGLKDGQLIVVKVYVNGEEDPHLRVVHEWSTSDMGVSGKGAYLPISAGGLPLSAGAYRIEMFVDSRLAQQGSFTVEE